MNKRAQGLRIAIIFSAIVYVVLFVTTYIIVKLVTS